MMELSQQPPGSDAFPSNQLHLRKKIYHATNVQIITDVVMLFLTFAFYGYLLVVTPSPYVKKASTPLPELHNKSLWTISPTQVLVSNATIHEEYNNLVSIHLVSPIIRSFLLMTSFAATLRTVDFDLPIPQRFGLLQVNIALRAISGLVEASMIIKVEIYKHSIATAIVVPSILYVWPVIQLLSLLDSIFGYSKIIIWIKKCERLGQVEQMAMASMAESLVSLA
ncbi:hypothetical protein L3Y34_005202 [Caenorhabditis briggsae]|uniref:Uncharacterized protein n=1 Tax=Caenorhabditis briggsae TaxID=6238 RepID=A0AAE9AD32_CAEBR|nr:hypothetical protein L3Y34_005202 [Caenorhabditis briggsae]